MDVRFTLTGTEPLLMHNSRLANPLDPAKIALGNATAKRTKTEDDHMLIAQLEWLGGLYYDPDAGPYLPGENIWRALYDAAKKRKMGPRIKEGVFITTNVNPLAYPGPRGTDALWADENFRLMVTVRNQQNRVLRTRPMFRSWKAEAEGIIDTDVIDLRDVATIAETAGLLVGIGDWRPRYGRFSAEVAAR